MRPVRKNGGYLTINYCGLSGLRVPGSSATRTLFTFNWATWLRCASPPLPRVFVPLGWTNRFVLRSWPISPHPPGADQGMEKQTGLVTHEHNQESGPVWLDNSWRTGEHAGGETLNSVWRSLNRSFCFLWRACFQSRTFVFHGLLQEHDS